MDGYANMILLFVYYLEEDSIFNTGKVENYLFDTEIFSTI
jgi:hypothetical protein